MIIPESPATNTLLTATNLSGCPQSEPPEHEMPFRPSDLHQVVAFQGVRFVRLGRDPGRRPVRGPTGGPPRVLPALPEAERQALTPLVRAPFEVAEKPARCDRCGVCPVVVLSQECEIRRRAPDRAEDDEVEPVEGNVGEA